jgi:hypothetical protein
MQQRGKGECENMILTNLEGEGDLAFLFIHALVGQPAKKNLVGRVIGIDSYSYASSDVE